jgi:hypothetical protein
VSLTTEGTSISDIILRPSPRALASDWRDRVRAMPMAALAAIGALFLVGLVRDPRLIGWVSTLLVVALVFALPNGLARLNALLVVSQDAIHYRGLLRRHRTCLRDEIDRIFSVRLAILGPRLVFTRLLLVDHSGSALLSIQEEWWSREDIDRLCQELSVPVTTLDEPLSPAKANRRFPNAASFLLVHRLAITTALLCCSGVVLLGIVGAHTK